MRVIISMRERLDEQEGQLQKLTAQSEDLAAKVEVRCWLILRAERC